MQHPEDAVHRRPDLVAHVGQELRLGLDRRLGGLLGLDQRQLLHLALVDIDHHADQLADAAVLLVVDQRPRLDPPVLARRCQDAPFGRSDLVLAGRVLDRLGDARDVLRMGGRPDAGGLLEGKPASDDRLELRRAPELARGEIGLEHTRPGGVHGQLQPAGVSLGLRPRLQQRQFLVLARVDVEHQAGDPG